jgi:ABC-2 type transport system ATP-binding protein
MTEQNMIEVDRLAHRYGEREALRGISFTVGAGEVFGLLGPNGGGKTTLFRILSTLLAPASGQARVCGLDVVTDAPAVRRRIGVVFQAPSLDGKLTAAENLRHQGHLYGLRGLELRARIAETLARLGLGDRTDDPTETLSGGLRRRVELAKAFLHRPSLLLLDEPSTGLDPGARRDLWEYLIRLRDREGATVVLTTHILEEAEGCDRLGILDRGELVALDSPAGLKAQIGGDVVTAQCADPPQLCAQIRARFGGEPVVVGNTVRVERERGHEFITELVEAFPRQLTSVTLSKPTLEDVFIHCTGHRFWDEEPSELSAVG